MGEPVRTLEATRPAPAARSGRPVTGARSRVFVLARHTFLEAVRDRVLYLLLGFGFFVFGASRLLAPLALGEGRRVTLDLGFAAISAFGCLTTIFVGHQLIFREVERKTLYFLFSRPLRRSEFVLGKYAGLCLVLGASVLLMGGMLAGVLRLAGYDFGLAFAQAVAFAWLEMAVLAAVAVFWATVSSPVLAGLLTLAAWVIGHGSADLRELAAISASPQIDAIAGAVLWVVPRLDLYHDILPVLTNTSFGRAAIFWGVSYAVLYAGAALLGAVLVLRRREFSL